MRYIRLSVIVVFPLLLLFASCLSEPQIDNSLLLRLLIFNTDGTDFYGFPNTYQGFECHNGDITAMNDNRRFILSNENLFIMDSVTHDIQVYLTDIEVSYYYGSSCPRIGVSYDDKYVVFCSEDNIFSLELETGYYEQLTFLGSDHAPRFGMDDNIYFSRYLPESSSSKLIRMNLNGSEIEEICEVGGGISEIFPGQVDPNLVYFHYYGSRFAKVEIDSGEVTDLFENSGYKVISRTNDDRYFSLSDESVEQYLYDTYANETITYFYPVAYERTYSKVFPNKKEALAYCRWDGATIRHWDLENNIQIGETILIPGSFSSGSSRLAISPDGKKAAILHRYKD